ncbi:putative calcium-binding protein CML31 [Wolffia australiana]
MVSPATRRINSSHESTPRPLELVFRELDEDGDGKVSPTELCSRMKKIGLTLSVEEATSAVDSVDHDGDGLLGFDEFADLMAEGEQEDEHREREMRAAFGVYECEGSGFITAASLKSALWAMGNRSCIEDCTAMIRKFDLDGDGVISFDEFKAMLAF